MYTENASYLGKLSELALMIWREVDPLKHSLLYKVTKLKQIMASMFLHISFIIMSFMQDDDQK